jgi:hypothetical protein
VHDRDTSEHGGGGGPHTPAVVQMSVALQHGSDAQDAAVSAQVGGTTMTGATHFP